MKKELRKKYKIIRDNIKEKNKKDEMIFNSLIKSKKVILADTILIYVSFNSEVDTFKLINYFLKIKNVAVPRIENNIMNFYYIDSLEELKENKLHILEPITNKKVINFNNCVCITPGLCFTKEGYRLGYGGGYYDKFFQNNIVYKIGICYKECLIDKLPFDEYDKRVDEVIYK